MDAICTSCKRDNDALLYGHLHHHTISGGDAYKCTDCGRRERESAAVELSTVKAARNEFAVIYYMEQMKFYDNLLADRL